MNDDQSKEEIVALIGEEACAKLGAAGFDVFRAEDFRGWVTEVEESNQRNKAVAKAAARAAGTRSILVELEVADGTTRVIVCDPDRDEEKTLRRILALLGAADPATIRQIPAPPPVTT